MCLSGVKSGSVFLAGVLLLEGAAVVVLVAGAVVVFAGVTVVLVGVAVVLVGAGAGVVACLAGCAVAAGVEAGAGLG